MSNIAGKAYAMNVITPLKWYTRWWSKLVFFVAGILPSTTKGLVTLSLIHYARWVILKANQFPRLSDDQPQEDLKYNYMLFFSNFNGSWDQYVDSFSSSIPGGLDLFWSKNIGYPKSLPMLPFHDYITSDQIWTNHYFNSTPIASSNDVKSARRVKDGLLSFMDATANSGSDEFEQKYNELLIDLQHDISQMAPTPVVSLAAAAAEKRRNTEHS